MEQSGRSAPEHRSNLSIAEGMALAFRKEGCSMVFGLMGDGNLHWMSAMDRIDGVRTVSVRHENSAVAMADGYSRSSGLVGVASVTTGPGITQMITSLTTAARHGSSIVVLAGAAPTTGAFDVQEINAQVLVEGVGAVHMTINGPEGVASAVREAFFKARSLHIPVVLTVPVDLQVCAADPHLESYKPAPANPEKPSNSALATQIEQAARCLATAKRPVVIAGRGAHDSSALEAIASLADHIGALLSTTLRAKGLFDGHPFHLGVAGGFASEEAEGLFKGADCVIAVGASLGMYTTAGGSSFPNATTIQIDQAPRVLWQNQEPPDIFVVGDANASCGSLVTELRELMPPSIGYRTPEVRHRIQGRKAPKEALTTEPGLFDPREVVRKLDELTQNDFSVVMGVGHYWHFAATGLTGRSPANYFFAHDFGAIGQALAVGMGTALGRPSERFMVLEGDGGLMMSVQELETAARERVPILTVVFNDGAFGAEVHKLRSLGLSESQVIFGRPDFASIASALGVDGYRLRSLDELPNLIQKFEGSGLPMVIDVPISREVLSRPMQQRISREPSDHQPLTDSIGGLG